MTLFDPAPLPEPREAVADAATLAELEHLRIALAASEERIAAMTSQLEIAHDDFETARAGRLGRNSRASWRMLVPRSKACTGVRKMPQGRSARPLKRGEKSLDCSARSPRRSGRSNDCKSRRPMRVGSRARSTSCEAS